MVSSKKAESLLSSFTQSDASSEWEGRMLSLSFAIPQVTETFKQFAGESNKTFTAATDTVSGFASTYTGSNFFTSGPAGKVTAGLVGAYTAYKVLLNKCKTIVRRWPKRWTNPRSQQQLSNNLTAYASALSE